MAFLGWLLTMLGQRRLSGAGGRPGRIIDALVQRLSARGVPVQCSSAGTARRSRRTGGRRPVGGRLQVRARRAVLADVSAPALSLDLVGTSSAARFVVDLDRFQWDSAILKVNWALSRPIPWKASEVSRAGTVHLGADFDSLTDFAADLSIGRIPRDPFLLFGQMTTSDPTRSPAGTESAWSYTPPAAPAHPHVGRRRGARRSHGDSRRAGGARVPRPDRRPVRARASDPESADANLSGGAVNGGTAALHQQLVFRPVPGLSRPETPIDGLFLASASAHPGGAVHGACGGERRARGATSGTAAPTTRWRTAAPTTP